MPLGERRGRGVRSTWGKTEKYLLGRGVVGALGVLGESLGRGVVGALGGLGESLGRGVVGALGVLGGRQKNASWGEAWSGP